MLRCQVRIAHRHSQTAVAKDFLQHQNIPAVHNEVAGEGVSENMGQLASRQRQTGPLHPIPECGVAKPEILFCDGTIIAIPLLMMFIQFGNQRIIYRH